MSQGRGAASPRSPAMHAGGLSIALAGDSGAKKRGLSQLNGGGGSSASDGFGAVGTSSAGGDGQHQQTYHQLPAGGLSSQLGSGTFPAIGQLYSSRGDSGNYSGFSSYNPDASPALSPLSATTPHGSQRSPLSEALAISAGAPRRKMPRRHPAPPGDASAAGNSFGEDYAALAQSDASDDDDFAVPMPGMPMSMRSGGGAAGGWAIAGAPPHLMTSGAMSLPHHASAAELAHGGFRPGSVMEGAGRKLRGTEAMRMRNEVLRQTGFLEPNSHNMFADHASSSPVTASSQ